MTTLTALLSEAYHNGCHVEENFLNNKKATSRKNSS